MTVKEVIDSYDYDYTEIGLYKFTGKRHYIHTDFIESYDGILSDMYDVEALTWELMDEEDYNDTILANSYIRADFGEWYDNSKAKILVIIVGRDAF